MITDNEAVLIKDEEIEKIEPIFNDVKEKNIAFKFVKRSIDVIAGIIGIILLIPITILVFVLSIFTGEGGSIFYTQKRIGKNGRTFKMYKYRTMCKNADKILEKRLQEDQEFRREYNKYKKVQNDDRITKCGKFLRSTSLDEFPQFINVLKGDMSLVGPRPYLPREKEDMGECYFYIIKLKPGITGPWQVRGRSKLQFKDRLELDKEYVTNITLRTDAKILIKTITRVIKKEGAI